VSSVLLLVTTSLADEILQEDISLKDFKNQICIVYFKVNTSLRKKIDNLISGVYLATSKSVNKLALEILKKVVSDKNRQIKFTPCTSLDQIWKSPIYIFRKKENFGETKEILLDVTWSAKPTRPEIAPSLENALSQTLENISGERENENIKILDFGAGKLRHSVFLLEKGYSVTAVDYENLFINPTEQVQGYMDKAKGFNTFQQIVYPSQLITDTKEHDLAILVNVLGIMPEPIERLFVLDQCYKKIKNNGHILLFNQHGDADQIKAVSELKITDGGCTTSRGRKTFYKDFNTKEELINLFALAGFEEVKDIDLKPSNNHTILFKKAKKSIINIEEIVKTKRPILERKVFIGDIDSETVIADVLDSDKHFKFGAILSFCLTLLKEGKGDAYRYEELVVLIIKYIFKDYFKTPEIQSQYDLDGGRKRVDIKVDWRENNNNSLKDMIISQHGLKSSFIPVECKNYSLELKNPEFAQIVDRCNKKHRHFAIIVCRKNDDRAKVIEQCFDRWHNHEYLIIVLDDDDLSKLLIYTDNQQQDQILNYIKKKIEEVRDRKN
jgi:2-polyprenyl-3-methyl-5-hydroxy-6-metoxy-1,4-benzoquinol methylase